MSSKAAWPRWVVPAVGAVLLAVAAGAVALQGQPTFGPPRITFPDAEVTPPPNSAPAATGTPEPQDLVHPARLDLSWVLVALLVVIVIVVAALLWRYLRRRLRAREVTAPVALGPVTESDLAAVPEAPLPEPIRRGLDRALDALEEPRQPRSKIERAWLGLEEGAADSGVRRLPAETPGEFVARVVARVAPERVAARALLDVYQRVRFGDGPVTADDVRIAREALLSLRASWQDATAASRPGETR